MIVMARLHLILSVPLFWFVLAACADREATLAPSPILPNAPPQATPATTSPAPTATPQPTPMPVVRLVLNAEAAVAGYWSDGSANVDVGLSLRNEGGLAFHDTQPIVVTCQNKSDAVSGCSGDVNLSLPGRFGPAAASLTLRLPMGESYTIELGYGGETLSVPLEVPERILGVERDTWECFSDHTWHGCSGFPEVVDKRDHDTPVKIWVNAYDEGFAQVFDEVMEDLSPVVNYQFEKVSTEEEADIAAYVGLAGEQLESLALGVGMGYSWGTGL